MRAMPIAYTIAHDSHGKSLDRATADVAGRQHGVVARTQLAEIGLARGAIEWRVARGRLHVIHLGVYAVGHKVVTREGRWMAAVLAGGRDALLSHRAAAALWDIRRAPHPLEITCPRYVRRPSIRSYWRPLPTDEVTIHEGIPVTTPSRTLFDLAAVVSLEQLRRAVNEAEIRRLWDSLSLADLLERHPRCRGAAAVRAMIKSRGIGITRSELEERFLAFLDRIDLVRPATNVALLVGGQWIEVDCVWHEQRLIVELDGYGTHRTRAAYEGDRARDRALVAAGWRVIRVTWRQLRDEPELLARDLRAALRHA
jgi:uncharacterized protein DUF559